MITYKRPATIGSHITNYRTLAHRNVVTAETGSSAPYGHCALCGNFDRHRRSMVNYTKVLETPSKTFQLKQKLNSTNYGIYMATCTICSKQYVGQTINKFSIRWNAYRSIWNSFDATADNDKAALLKHFYKYHDLTQNNPFRNVLKLPLWNNPKLAISRSVKINGFTKSTRKLIFKKWYCPIPSSCSFGHCLFSWCVISRSALWLWHFLI